MERPADHLAILIGNVPLDVDAANTPAIWRKTLIVRIA